MSNGETFDVRIDEDVAERTARIERQLDLQMAFARKAVRLDIAARLLAAMAGSPAKDAKWPEAWDRMRTKAFEQADALIAENEARP